MENLPFNELRDAAIQRSHQHILQRPLTIKTLDDVRKIVRELDPNLNSGRSTSTVKASIDVIESGQSKKYDVKTTVKSQSKRDMLMVGFEILRERIKLKDITVAEPVTVNGVPLHTVNLNNTILELKWLDGLVTELTGGYRKDMNICWKIGNSTYFYDIFNHILEKHEDKQ